MVDSNQVFMSNWLFHNLLFYIIFDNVHDYSLHAYKYCFIQATEKENYTPKILYGTNEQ